MACQARYGGGGVSVWNAGAAWPGRTRAAMGRPRAGTGLPPTMLRILTPYALYVALYLGVALTGGSVVHLPLAPGRYLLIGAVGVLVFIAASAADARRRPAAAVEGGGGELGRAHVRTPVTPLSRMPSSA